MKRFTLLAGGLKRSVGPPTITMSSVSSGNVGASQTSGTTTAPTVASLVVVGVTGIGTGITVSSMTFNGDVSGSISASPISSLGGVTMTLAVYQAVVPAGNSTLSVTVNYSSNPFNGSLFAVGYIPTSQLNSQTAVGSNIGVVTSSLTESVNITTSKSDVVFVISGCSNITSGNVGTLSGTETYTTDSSFGASGVLITLGHATGTAANASSTVTVTYVDSGSVCLAAVSYR